MSLGNEFFADIDLDLVGREVALSELDTDMLQVALHDPENGMDLAPAIEEMARDYRDEAHPERALRSAPSPEGFTLCLLHRHIPGKVISMVTAEMTARDDRLDISIEMIFTDAEYRGEGLGRLMVAVIDEMVGRAVDAWPYLPLSEGDWPETVSLSGEPVSEGGLVLLTAMRDAARDRICPVDEEEMEPA